jgi:hypothetical protein
MVHLDMASKKNLKIITLCVGQLGIMLSCYSLWKQDLLLQAIAQVVAALSSLLWVSLLRKKVTLLSLISIVMCGVAVFCPSPWLLFGAGTTRAIDYQIILFESEI